MLVTEGGKLEDQRNGESIPEHLNLYLRQIDAERDPVVWLGLNESADGAELTIDEASLLIDVLTNLVSKARGTEDDATA